MRAVNDGMATPYCGDGEGEERAGPLGWSSVLAQRAASEGPRWTRAVKDGSATLLRERCKRGRSNWSKWFLAPLSGSAADPLE